MMYNHGKELGTVLSLGPEPVRDIVQDLTNWIPQIVQGVSESLTFPKTDNNLEADNILREARFKDIFKPDPAERMRP